MKMKKQLSRLCVYLLLIAGCLLVADGVWLRLKAQLAQQLLQYAWQQSLVTGKRVKPWPWADTWPVARLQVERLGVDQIVLAGGSGEVLAFGPGRLPASAQPMESGNAILAGHRDTTFRFLKYLAPGDRVRLTTMSHKRLDYRVTASHITPAEQLYLEPQSQPWLTLITCYPFESVAPATPLRYVVFAQGVDVSGHAL